MPDQERRRLMGRIDACASHLRWEPHNKRVRAEYDAALKALQEFDQQHPEVLRALSPEE